VECFNNQPKAFIPQDNYLWSNPKCWLVYGVQRHFQQYFSYIVAVSFIFGGNRKKPPTCGKSFTNYKQNNKSDITENNTVLRCCTYICNRSSLSKCTSNAPINVTFIYYSNKRKMSFINVLRQLPQIILSNGGCHGHNHMEWYLDIILQCIYNGM
jgi:hypothetical protein